MPFPQEITDQGPTSFTLAQARAFNVDDWREKFGNDARTGPEDADGQIIDIQTLIQYLGWQALLRLWSDSFVRTARGSALDGLLDMFGKKRKPARASLAEVVVFGAELTPVALGTQVETTGSGALFATTAAVTTGALLGSDTWMTRIPATVTPAVDYSIDIDATIYTHTAIGGDTSTTVATALRALVNAGSDGTATLAGIDSSGRALLTVDVTGGPGIVGNDGTPVETFPAARAPAEATTTGPLTAPAGTLQILPTPIAGIEGASNDADATVGRDVETDDEFRARHYQSLFGLGCGTDQAIRQKVLDALDAQGIEFVETCNVTSNRTVAPVDAEGRPIGSFETVLRYADTAPADADARVAAAIASCMPAGVEPYGQTFTESVEVYPGNFVDVSATRVTTLYLHLTVTVTPGEGFPTAGDPAESIRVGVVDGWDAIALEGQDWYRTSSAAAASDAVNGTALDIQITSDLTPDPGDAPAFASVPSQPASAREIIDLDGSRVTVVIV
jgi:hypothetical protein